MKTLLLEYRYAVINLIKINKDCCIQILVLAIYLGLMCLFWQANEKSKKVTNVLMTVLSGDTAVQAQTMTDKEVVDMCMNTLRKLFPYEV